VPGCFDGCKITETQNKHTTAVYCTKILTVITVKIYQSAIKLKQQDQKQSGTKQHHRMLVGAQYAMQILIAVFTRYSSYCCSVS